MYYNIFFEAPYIQQDALTPCRLIKQPEFADLCRMTYFIPTARHCESHLNTFAINVIFMNGVISNFFCWIRIILFC